LVVVDTTIDNVTAQFRSHGRLEVMLHNTGGRLVVIDAMRFEIKHVYVLPQCASQGSLEVTHVYGVPLPRNAKPGQVIRAPLHQQVGPDEADRFAVSLSTERSRARTEVYLFDLRVSLLNDGPQSPLPIGRVLVSLPGMPNEGQYYWVRDTAAFLRQWASTDPSALDLWRMSMSCWRSNTKILRRALRGSGARSIALSQLEHRLVTPSLAAIE
jgi:hypothetical protein